MKPMAPVHPVYCSQHRRRMGAVAGRGFTLIELVMVLVLLGVLAVYATPRLFSSSGLNARGFHDATMAYLRYAQKTAIAQRRTVCVQFTANSVALQLTTVAAASVCNAANSNAYPGPDGALSASGKGVGYAGGIASAALSFDGLGQPLDSSGAVLGAARTISISGVADITVEAATGYVHD